MNKKPAYKTRNFFHIFSNSWADHVILYSSNSSGLGNLNGCPNTHITTRVNLKFQLNILSFLILCLPLFNSFLELKLIVLKLLQGSAQVNMTPKAKIPWYGADSKGNLRYSRVISGNVYIKNCREILHLFFQICFRFKSISTWR